MLDVASGHAAARAVAFDQVSIVTADRSHAAGLRVLVAEALAQEGQNWSGKPTRETDAQISLEEVMGLIAAQRSQLLVAMQDQVIVGCVLVTRLPGSRCALGLLGVDPRFRRRGLGAQLIAAAERAAATIFGSDQIELCVLAEREQLAAYYARFGFAPTGEHRTVPLAEVTMEFLVMSKPLAHALVPA